MSWICTHVWIYVYVYVCVCIYDFPESHGKSEVFKVLHEYLVTAHSSDCLLRWKPNFWDRCWWKEEWFISNAGNLKDGKLLSQSPSFYLWSGQQFLKEVGGNSGVGNSQGRLWTCRCWWEKKVWGRGRGCGSAGSVLVGPDMDIRGQRPWPWVDLLSVEFLSWCHW